MADVFISYARASESTASRAAEALSKEGFSVWWDSNLLPHNKYAQLIEDEMRAAKAVLVIWSEAAVGSQWVRAEAELGRALGTLVQIRIDDCVIPLPFNQFQTAQLTGWNGDPDDRQWRSVMYSVAELSSREISPQRGLSPRKSPLSALALLSGPRKNAVWTGLAAGAITLLIGGVWLSQGLWTSRMAATKIAVEPFDAIGGSPPLRDFAAGLTDSLQGALSTAKLSTVSRSDAAMLASDHGEDQLRRLGVRLLFTGETQTQGADNFVRIHLDDPLAHTSLWAAELSAPAPQTVSLQGQVAARTIAVLGCAGQALRPKNGLADPNELALYFHACDLAETSHHGMSDAKSAYALFDAFRQVIAAVPNFADAHAQLAKHLAFVLPGLPDEQANVLRQEANTEAHRALQLDPRSADAYVALGLLQPSNKFAEREAMFDKALAINPDWPHANGFLANDLRSVGRLNDAALHYSRAAAVNPQSLDWTYMAASGLIWNGQPEEATTELARLKDIWPHDRIVWRDELEALAAEHRWGDILSELDRADDYPNTFSPSALATAKATYAALKSGDKVQLAAARDLYMKEADDLSNAPGLIGNLSMLGFVDNAFDIAGRYAATPDASEYTAFLFSPKTAAMRLDPRFIGVAAKLGLVSVWRKTGKWPDFCADSNLPYNCRAEAEKVLRS